MLLIYTGYNHMQTRVKKAKGRRLQNWFVDKLKDYFSFTDEDIRAAIMGETGADIKLISTKAKDTFPFDVECKNQEGFNNVYKAYEQAKVRIKTKHHPLLVLKMNNRKPLAILDADLFFRILTSRLWSTNHDATKD